MTRVFSGIKPTGDMQLGNFIGAVQRWVDAQPEAGSPAAKHHDDLAVACSGSAFVAACPTPLA